MHEMQRRNDNQVQTQSRSQLEHASDRPASRPPVDVYENQDEYLLLADMPGVTGDNLRINLQAGRLTIEGNPQDGPQGTALDREWTTTMYRRTFDIPDTIDTEKVSAELRQGILRLHLPKQESVKPRRIQVRAG